MMHKKSETKKILDVHVIASQMYHILYFCYVTIDQFVLQYLDMFVENANNRKFGNNRRNDHNISRKFYIMM